MTQQIKLTEVSSANHCEECLFIHLIVIGLGTSSGTTTTPSKQWPIHVLAVALISSAPALEAATIRSPVLSTAPLVLSPLLVHL